MLRTFCFIFATLAAAACLAQPAGVNRVLRTFDFEERRLGNVEDLPMHWNKVDGSGLPRYVNGKLTTDNPRSGRYSFRFDLNGGSLIYRYEPGQIKVSIGAHYRVEGYARTTVLPHARARLTAYMVDADGKQLPETVHRSELYAARTEDEDWHRLVVELSAETESAYSMVIELEVLQPQLYAANTLGKRTLFSQDIRGSAWFDDVMVSQVPRVKMSTDRPGNIFRRGEPLRMQVLVSDRFTDDLAAQLLVHDAMGKKTYQRSGALDIGSAETLGPGRKRLGVLLPELTPGWYSVSLVMSSRGQYVGDQKLDLVVLADNAPTATPDGRFGVVATDLPFEGWTELPEVLATLGTGRVKLAVWSATEDVESMDPAAFDQILVKLQERHIVPTACLVDLPPSIADKLLARQRMVQAAQTFAGTASQGAAMDSNWPYLLKADPADWQPKLSQLLARHANHLERWQLGADGTDCFVTQPGMRKVYAMVYDQFAGLMFKPDLAMPWPAWYELDGTAPATVALSVPASVLPHQLPLYMSDLAGGGQSAAGSRQSAVGKKVPANLSITLQALEKAQYGREVQIRDFAQRVTYALAADARRIDVPLPFTVRRETDDVIQQPQELYIITRTLVTALGGATFKGRVPIAEGVEAFLFDRGGQGVLVLWDRGMTSGIKQLAVNLGERPMRMDLWGNVTPLLGTDQDKTSGKTQLSLGSMPVLLLDIDAQIAQLRASVAIDQPLIESSFQAHTRKLRFSNPYKTSISGSVRLKAPPGWTLNPPTHTFSLNPGETFEHEVSIEFPYNSPGGAKILDAQFTVQADRNSSFNVPITVNLGLSDVGMQTLALRDGEDVIVQQVIQNYVDRPIDYSAFAIVSGQARQERLVTNLGAGRTTIKRYRFPGSAIAPGTKIRVGVKELNGTRILNDEVEIQ